MNPEEASTALTWEMPQQLVLVDQKSPPRTHMALHSKLWSVFRVPPTG
jgi:hypothetical protein